MYSCLLFVAFCQVLGVNVDQKGSSVTFEKLRFDFSLNRGVRGDELEQVERRINEIIRYWDCFVHLTGSFHTVVTRRKRSIAPLLERE